jgi:F-type H+-transporting ATPase subunit c
MDPQAFKYLAVGFFAFAFAGAAIGVGKIFASALEGIARNPSAEDKISKYMFIGAGLAEAMGLFGLVLALLLMFA